MISKNLILRYINGHTSEEETKEVVEWIKASEENQRSYMNIRKLNDLIILVLRQRNPVGEAKQCRPRDFPTTSLRISI